MRKIRSSKNVGKCLAFAVALHNCSYTNSETTDMRQKLNTPNFIMDLHTYKILLRFPTACFALCVMICVCLCVSVCLCVCVCVRACTRMFLCAFFPMFLCWSALVHCCVYCSDVMQCVLEL
jgi:hypothetical protein